MKKFSDPYPNFFELVEKTDAQMQRIGWTKERGRTHIINIYGKRGRALLSEAQLQDFLLYLQSQPDK